METKNATQMASVYGLKSPQAFNKLLAKCGVLVESIHGYVLADNLRGRGYSTVVEEHYFLPNGFRATKKKSVWTERGQTYIRQRLGRIGIVPNSEQTGLFGDGENAAGVHGMAVS